MKMKKTLLALAMFTSAFTMNAMAVEQKDVELQFDPSTVEIISLDQLESPRALSSVGGVTALAAAGAWSDVVYNPNITTAGVWVFGPEMEAPSSTPSTSVVQNITFQWNIWNYDSNLTTYICESTLTYCFDISGNFGAGVNTVAYGLSIPANRSWVYVFKYTGSSPSLNGQNGSVAVTYQ
jgi:hypothetical protein